MKILLNLAGAAALALVSFVDIRSSPGELSGYTQPALNDLSTMRQNDLAFLTSAASGEIMEVELGQLAQLNSLDPVLKELGSKIVRDHGQGNDRIKTLSTARNIIVPSVLSDDQKKIKDGLQKKTGPEFDKDYIDLVIADHIKSIRQFEKEAASGSDKEIKAFADSSLQMLHTHLDAAQTYKKTVIKG